MDEVKFGPTLIRDAEAYVVDRPGETGTDAIACARIYAPYVTDSVISFETTAPTPAAMAERIAASRQRHAWLVAVADDDVIGYAYGTDFNERAAYQWSTTVSIYLAPQAAGRGLGSALYGKLLDRLTGLGYRQAFGGVVLPNDASVALHTRCGFEPCALYRNVGYKFGRWLDVAWYQKALGADLTDTDGRNTPSQARPEPSEKTTGAATSSPGLSPSQPGQLDPDVRARRGAS